MSERIAPRQPLEVSKHMSQEFKNVMIKSWTPQSEVWSFKYGSDILGCMNGVSASFIMHSIRKQLKIRPHARMTCYLPVAAISYVLTDLFHDNYITKQILGFESCPLCIVIKAGLMQASLGIGYPLVLSPIIGFYVADKLLTYPVPSIHRAPRELFYLWMKMTCRNPRFIYTSIAIQTIAACLVTNQKQSFFYNFINYKN